MMASSQVEIARSSPFGCPAVHNPRDSCYQNNLSNLVTSCISNDNSRRIDFTDLWVHRPQWQTTATTSAANNKCITSNSDDSIDYTGVKIDSRHQKDKWARAREMIFSVDHRSAKCGGFDSPKQSEGSVEIRNLGGVSSLVQKWRGFEAEAKCSSKSNSAAISQDIAGPEPPAQITSEEDPFGDWESDRTAVSGPPSSRSRDSDATESERLRVADIIRKLTEERSNEAGSDSPPRVRTSTDQSEQKCHSPVVNSPRIRGRQAYNDLLMQMERDRRKELEGLVGRKPVSRFSHRGRIQAMLRIRFLRRGMDAKEARHLNSCTASESQKLVQSAILHFRERINIPSAQNGSLHSGSCHKETINNPSAAPNLHPANQQGKENQHEEVTNTRSCPRERADHIQDLECSITSKENDHDHSSHPVNENIQHDVHQLHGYGHLHHEADVLSSTVMQDTNCESSNYSLSTSVETARTINGTDFNPVQTTKSLDSIKINVHETEEEATIHQVAENSYDLTADCAHPQSFLEGDASNQIPAYWVSDVSHPEVGWEELHCDYKQQEGSSMDWIDEVSRPRSDWEDLRQERYREMLDPFLDNEEIRVLLERRSVSTFLSSGLREKIDHVMISHAQGKQINNVTREKKHERFPEHNQVVVSEVGEREDGEEEQDEEREDYGEFFDEYEESESSVGQQDNETDDYTDVTTSSPAASWPQNQGPELSYDSGQVASPCTRESSSNYYSEENGTNSSYRASTRPAIEMELIYDLRGHMERLHQEISELRKSIKCCVDMQIELQRSIKKEVAMALNHSDAKKGQRKSGKKVTSGGRCCVCCKMQVDSLLYRCGHMCTCFKCGQELQWSNGKCPMCSAPIVDVVRTYTSNIQA